MRYHELLFETVAERTTPITPREFKKALHDVLKQFETYTWCHSPRDINEGDCGSFTQEVMDRLGLKFYERHADVRQNSTKWYYDSGDHTVDLDKLRVLGEPVPTDIPERVLARNLGAVHYWLTYRNRHYDAECLKGVDHILDLPFFQRIIARLRGQPVSPSSRGE